MNVLDLLFALAQWGTGAGDCNLDGTTNVLDVLDILANWGACIICGSCDTGFDPCGTPGSGCIEQLTAEGDCACVATILCLGASDCPNGTSDCPAGQVCVVNACCTGLDTICVPLCSFDSVTGEVKAGELTNAGFRVD